MALDAARRGLKTAVTNAINEAVPLGSAGNGLVVLGWPNAQEIARVCGEDAQYQWYVTIFPLPTSRNSEVYPPEVVTSNPVDVTLTATVVGNVITFGGTPAANFNVHAFVLPGQVDAYFITSASDTLASIAANMAAAINAGTYGGVLSASASGPVVTVNGAVDLQVNIGGTATCGTEVGRITQDIQVTVWAADDPIRSLIHDAIVTGVGTVDRLWVPMPDGNALGVTYLRESQDDSQSSKYNLFIAHIIFTCEYPIIRYVTATQVESIRVTQSVDGFVQPTVYVEGP